MLNSSRDENKGACRVVEGGEEPAKWPRERVTSGKEEEKKSAKAVDEMSKKKKNCVCDVYLSVL